jgi:phospho-N-acetylmuramoyl-pentapeptide-transferase
LLLWLLDYFRNTSLWNLFQYVTLRAALAATTAFLTAVLLGPRLIAALRAKKIGEKVQKGDSAVLDQMHAGKAGTPTMGGLLVLIAILVAIGLFGRLSNHYVVLAALSTIGFSCVGLIDDWTKLSGRNKKGISPRLKMVLLLAVAFAIAIAIVLLAKQAGEATPYVVRLPFLKDVVLDLSWMHGSLYLVFCIVVLLGSSNAVNLTDGLDGLATGCAAIAAAAFSVIIYVVGRKDTTEYLLIAYVPGSGELAIVCAALAGACLGFLWFNSYPAQIFMGDTGSLLIGGLLGFVAIVARQELVLPIVGGVFVMEAASVILQVGSFKLTGKRIFRIAPIHHHFQFAGWHEVKVVSRFWILAVIFAIAGVATLKVR